MAFKKNRGMVAGLEGREEWLAWRHERFGASDAPLVMGRGGCYGGRDDLIKSKVFPLVIKENLWLEQEKSAGEAEAISEYTRLAKLAFAGQHCEFFVEYQPKFEHKFKGVCRPLSCTLDGLLHCSSKKATRSGCRKTTILIEVKCVDKASEGDGIPNRYYYQLLQQYHVLRACCRTPNKVVYIEYSRKASEIIKMIELNDFCSEKNFSALLQAYARAEEEIEALKANNDAAPLELDECSKRRIKDLVEQYKELLPNIEAKKQDLEALESRADEIRKTISLLVGDQEYKFSHQGIKVAKVSVKGAIDIDKLPIDVSIDECRKPNTYSVRITKEKVDKIPKGLAIEDGKIVLQ